MLLTDHDPVETQEWLLADGFACDDVGGDTARNAVGHPRQQRVAADAIELVAQADDLSRLPVDALSQFELAPVLGAVGNAVGFTQSTALMLLAVGLVTLLMVWGMAARAIVPY